MLATHYYSVHIATIAKILTAIIILNLNLVNNINRTGLSNIEIDTDLLLLFHKIKTLH